MPAVAEKTEEKTNRRASILALCGLAGALLLGVLPITSGLSHGNSIGQLLTHEAIVWCCALAVLLWLRFVERLPLSSIGFCQPTWKGVIFGVLVAIVLVAIQFIQFTIIVPLFHLNIAPILATLQDIMHTPYWYRILLVLRAAVTEEILFRGYIIEKVRQLTRSNALAVIVSAAAFTYAHLGGWGPVQLISVAAGGVVFALFYVWRRDLPSNMLAHFLADAAGLLTR